MFQASFKYYKSKNPPPSLKDVLIIGDDHPALKPVNTDPLVTEKRFPGLRPPGEWKIYHVTSHPGLLVVANPFDSAAQRYWMTRCIVNYSTFPNTTNILETGELDSPCPRDDEASRPSWWQILGTMDDPGRWLKFAKTLRWATLGYQYDWTNKLYDEARRVNFPADLDALVRYVANVLGYGRFSPEAAIVNYYPVGATLSGHTDHSEDDQAAPLFSFSFGQPAVFLIGSTTRDERPDAILLRSGDVLVMSGASRQCFHAVPRICTVNELPTGLRRYADRWNGGHDWAQAVTSDCPLFDGEDVSWDLIEKYIQHSRININVRQVLKENQIALQKR